MKLLAKTREFSSTSNIFYFREQELGHALKTLANPDIFLMQSLNVSYLFFLLNLFNQSYTRQIYVKTQQTTFYVLTVDHGRSEGCIFEGGVHDSILPTKARALGVF